MRYKALIMLVVTALMTFIVEQSGAFAGMRRFTQGEILHAKAVHAHHAEGLLRLPGVRGVAIGDHLGRPGIVILVDDESHLAHMPRVVEDMTAVVQVVGEITAHAINLGTSGGNSLICSNYCSGGTVGFKVCDNTNAGVSGILTNNHVAASGCPNLCPNNAPPGTIFFSPGVIDTNPVCSTTGATTVGSLSRFVPLALDGTTINYADAAFVQSADSIVSNNIQGLGAQNNTVAAAYLGQTVCKSGRTSGMTCGTVTGINLTVNVNYGKACGVARFNNAIMYSPTAPYTVMSQSGDSGAPVVDADTSAAVALNFAGTSNGVGIGNPIDAALSALEVSLCDGVSGTPSSATTVTTSPSGKQIIVDNVTYTAPQTFNWPEGSSHTLGVASPQSGGTGTRHLFSSWSDGGPQTHTIMTSAAIRTYTASFNAQYQLTTSSNPAAGGSVAPNCSTGCWFNGGSSTNVIAAANNGYTFTSWSGAITSTSNPAAVTMNAPKAVAANFGSSTNVSANLTPYQPSGWSDEIVVSNTRGRTSDSKPLYSTNSLYVDWAVLNNGTAATNRTFYTYLYVDGVQKASWSYLSQLRPNYYTYVSDYSIGRLSKGTHTIKITTDSTGVIPESNEADNTYTKTITVQ